MNAALAILVVIGVCLLGFQAVSLFIAGQKRSDQRWTSLLTASIAALISLNLYLACENLIVSDLTEGLLLAQGNSQWLLRLLVFVYPIAATLVVQSAAAARDESHRPYLLFAAGTFVAGCSAWSVSARGPIDLADGTIYAYDLYSPWLLLWVSGCVVDWGLLVAGLRRRELRRWFSATLSLGVAGLGASFAQRAGALSSQWSLAYWLTFGLAILFALRVGLGLLAPAFYVRHLHLRRTLITILLVALMLPVAIFHEELNVQGAQPYVGASCCAVVLVTLAWMGRRALRKDQLFLNGEGTLVRYVLALSLLALLLFAVDLFFLKIVPVLWNLLGSSIAAIVLVELAAEGPLHNVGTAATLWGESSTVRIVLARCVDGIRRTGEAVWKALSWILALPWLPRLGLQMLIPALVYVVVDELPNAQRTVVQTFDVYADSQSDSDAGKRFAVLVVNRLNGIAQDLDENMLIAVPAALQAQASDPRKTMQQAAVHTSSAEADIGRDVLDLGPLGKVRLGKILAFMQEPIRRVLGTRYIEGALLQQGDGFRMVAHSTTGQSWTYPQADQKPTDLLTLARYLTFSVLSTDSDWMERGMTLDADAFEAFLDSTWSQLRQDRLAGNTGTLAATAETIANLRAALAADPAFAVARYRLALALSKEGQLALAVDQLRSALKARPGFGPAQDALARLLERGLDNDLPLVLRAIGVHDQRPDHREQLANLRREARELWTAMVRVHSSDWSLRDRAAAHLGLCSLAMEENRPEAHADGIFNCTVAAQIYDAAPGAELQARDRDALLAYAFNALGVQRTRRAQQRQGKQPTFEPVTWGCGAGQFNGAAWSVARDGGGSEATQLFRIAHALSPHDNTITCNLAAAEFAAGERARFDRLGTDREMQLSVCRDLLDTAVDQRSAPHFRGALQACERAIESDPGNVEALNLYAYAFRIWWYTLPKLDDAERADGTLAARAEERARQAVQLAQTSAMEGDRGMVESTLGEVLLALGRPHEALTWLNQASEHVPKHVQFSEVERDLAEALVCAHYEDAERTEREPHASCKGSLEHADAILAEIRAREAKLESNVYAAYSESLDREWIRRRCDQVIRPRGPTAAVEAPKAAALYPRNKACGTKLLRVNAPAKLEAKVHLWGNGDAVTGDAVGFTHVLSPKATYGLYFAQLEDGKGSPLSAPYALDTLPNTDAACADEDGVIDLTFTLPERAKATLWAGSGQGGRPPQP